MAILRRTCANVNQPSELRFGAVRGVGRGIAALDWGPRRASGRGSFGGFCSHSPVHKHSNKRTNTSDYIIISLTELIITSLPKAIWEQGRVATLSSTGRAAASMRSRSAVRACAVSSAPWRSFMNMHVTHATFLRVFVLSSSNRYFFANFSKNDIFDLESERNAKKPTNRAFQRYVCRTEMSSFRIRIGNNTVHCITCRTLKTVG